MKIEAQMNIFWLKIPKRSKYFTLFWTMYPVTMGLTMPGIVPMVLEIPIKMAAYWKIISRINVFNFYGYFKVDSIIR